jgi:hypothetical protein
MPIPISISSSPIVKVGRPAAGTVQGEGATPIERVLAMAFSAIRLTSASGASVSAFAPASL